MSDDLSFFRIGRLNQGGSTIVIGMVKLDNLELLRRSVLLSVLEDHCLMLKVVM